MSQFGTLVDPGESNMAKKMHGIMPGGSEPVPDPPSPRGKPKSKVKKGTPIPRKGGKVKMRSARKY